MTQLEEFKSEVNRICAHRARIPKSRQQEWLKSEADKLPPDQREILLTLVTSTIDSQSPPMKWEKITMIASGILFIIFLAITALFLPNPSRFQVFVFKTILAIAGSAFVVVLPGLLEVESRTAIFSIRAGGPFGVFVIIFLSKLGGSLGD